MKREREREGERDTDREGRRRTVGERGGKRERQDLSVNTMPDSIAQQNNKERVREKDTDI